VEADKKQGRKEEPDWHILSHLWKMATDRDEKVGDLSSKDLGKRGENKKLIN
jgi:hypothetical protein